MASLEWSDLVDFVVDDDSMNPPYDEGVPNLNPSLSWSERYIGMVHFWLERCRKVPNPLREKMVLFWHGHLTSSMGKVGDHKMMFDQNQLFRRAGLGNFTELLQQASVQPAMLKYLDNSRNLAKSPNENFARELLELFTLGVGNYTEEDVRSAARAWSGHLLVDDAYLFEAHKHDAEPKTFFGQTRNWDGPEIVDYIVNGPKQQTVAHYIASKLWSFFAYPNPEQAVVSALSSVFITSGMNIKDLVRAIFMHPAFVSEKAKRALLKSPIEYQVSIMRQTGLTCEDLKPEWSLKDLGQQAYYPPNVSGWPPNAYWSNTTSIWARSNIASSVRWILYRGDFLDDPGSLAPEDAVTESLEIFGLRNVSVSTRSALLEYVLAERQHSLQSERAGLLLLPMLSPEFWMA